jgi:LCP family protein required for cell wall assembly
MQSKFVVVAVLSLLMVITGLIHLQLRIAQDVEELLTRSRVPPAGLEPNTITDEEPPIQRSTFLFLGLDYAKGHENSGARSDTIIVLTVISTGEAHLLSIPRDSRVEIPGRGFDKINHAYAFGGIDLCMQTVSQFLGGVQIDHWSSIDASMLPTILDYFGPVQVNIELNIPSLGLKAGPQELSGRELANYLRWRYDGSGDIGRVRRQQGFVVETIKQLQLSIPYYRLPTLYYDLKKSLRTSLTLVDIIWWSYRFKKFDLANLHSHHVPGDYLNLNGISYWGVNAAKLSPILDEMFPELRLTPKLLHKGDVYEK